MFSSGSTFNRLEKSCRNNRNNRNKLFFIIYINMLKQQNLFRFNF